MSTDFGTEMADVALDLLTEYGATIQVQRSASTVFDPTTGSVSSTVSYYTGVGNTTTYNSFEVNNETILTTDTKLLFYSTTVPKVGDVMTVNGQNLRVLNVNIDNVQNTNVLYTIQLRQ